MANFIVVIDPLTERRKGFIETIKPLLPPVDGLVTERCSAGDFCAIWAANPQAPISYISETDGATVVWGEPTNAAKPQPVEAVQLKNLWENATERSKITFDGFYAAMVYRADSGLIFGADILGVFPVYYWTNGKVLLVGSSPELFRYHSCFKAEPDLGGLVDILLVMHTFGGRTLFKGVRRLSAGHILLWQRGKAAEEVQQYKIQVSEKYFSLPFSAHLDILDRSISETISRHVPADGNCGMLLSGGLDSRMLAGYLVEKSVKPQTFTMGKHTDIEMQSAIPVAKALGLRHHPVEIAFDQYSRYANTECRWEHISNGFNNITDWALPKHLRELADHIVMGHMFDAVVGTRYINWVYSSADDTMNFDSYFTNLNSWGISLHILKRLLRREIFGDMVDETIGQMRALYESFSELESQRAWCYNLYNRQRFHVGGAAWILSFGAWPVLPALDRQLLETAGAMPASTIAERRAEIELFCRRFPKLAALPLDRNSYNTEPLRPRLRYQLSKYAFNKLRHLSHLGHHSKNIERRYYYRIYDFNNPGWLAVRQQAETYREKLFGLFHKEVLEQLLPGPDVRLSVGNGIIEASGLKTLLGLMLWSKDNL